MKIFRLLMISVLALNFAFAIDLNSASSKQLMSLGLSKSDALKIIKYRKVRKFKSTDELYKVQGLSGDKVNKIKNNVSVATKKEQKRLAKNDSKNNKISTKNAVKKATK